MLPTRLIGATEGSISPLLVIRYDGEGAEIGKKFAIVFWIVIGEKNNIKNRVAMIPLFLILPILILPLNLNNFSLA